MRIRVHGASRFAVAILVTILAAISSNSQTPSELRAKYGEPNTSNVQNGRPTREQYLVRPNIQMTITYTKDGRLCEASFAPVPLSTPSTPASLHGPTGDYMSTADVISLIDELVPVESRGKNSGAWSVNGGDPEMKLHHPGCWGAYGVNYENVSIYTSSWCGGGTFSATIHWNNTKCRGERLTVTKKG